jgi:UDP-N-acetylglucosamine--N-acetylmuramyl-(pentapeptide) pyrophosphoryl-undecaprenol N-acetylglucosamine transferase
MNRLLIVAAGTGGHVTPGLAIAARLRASGWSVSWLGTRHGIERSLVEPAGIDFDAVDFANFRGKGALRALQAPLLLLRALAQCRAVLRRRAPVAVFATGGYLAVPAGWAARAARVPLALLNPDAAPLLSTRLLRGAATLVLCGFDAAAAGGRRTALLSGNPVREAIAALPPPQERFAGRSGPLRLLVMGGSLGASVLNQVVPAALARFPAAARPRVVHQAGHEHVAATLAAYRAAAVDAEVVPYLDDIAARYAWADLALCRAGAITATELAVCGLGSILVPLVARTTAHQAANARFLAARGAAIHLAQGDFDPASVAATLGLLDRPALLAMARAARAIGRPDATAVIAAAIERIAGVAVDVPAAAGARS